MGGRAEAVAIDATTPRDRLQEEFVKVLARPVRESDDKAADRRVADLHALVESSDLAAGSQLLRRLDNSRDSLGRYFHSRLRTVTGDELRDALRIHVLAERGVAPPSEQQVSTADSRPLLVKPSAAARQLVAILRRGVKTGSSQRFEMVYEHFKNLDLVDAVRLRARLANENDELRELLFARLTAGKAEWLIEHVLDERARGFPVAELPENLSAGQIEARLNRPVLLKDGRTGETATREEESYRQALFVEAQELGVAESVATPERLKTIELEGKHPGLPERSILELYKEVEKNKKWLESGPHDAKVALQMFFIQMKRLRRIGPTEDEFVHVLGTWAKLLRADHPTESGSYLSVWTRDFGRSGVALERLFKDKLNRKGYIWIQAVVMPGPLEFIAELQRTGELFELKNFKAAALGSLDAVVEVGRGLVALADPATWKQIHDDFAEHGRDIIHAFKRETIDLFAAQLKRDFAAFARLDETQQARAASFFLTAAVIDGKLPDIVDTAATKAKAVKKVFAKTPDSDAIPTATAHTATRHPVTKKKYLRGKHLKSAFRKWALTKIKKGHPLAFLVKLNEKGDAIGWRGRRYGSMDELIGDMEAVDAGHSKSASLIEVEGRIENERVVLELRWDNQGLSKGVEGSHVGGYFPNKPAIDIAGVPVDLATAETWVKYGLLNKKWLKKPLKHVPGWNQDP